MQYSNYKNINHGYGSFEQKPRAGKLFAFIWVTFLGFLAWASLTALDETIRVEGVLIPDGSVQTVQNRLAGTVTKINVVINQRVKKGDVLFQMEDEDVVANFTNNEIGRIAAMAKAERLEAEVNRFEAPNYSDFVRVNGVAFMESETRIFENRRMLLESQLSQIETMQEEMAARIAILDEKLVVVRQLVKQGYESRFQLLDLETQREEVAARLTQATANHDSVTNEFLSRAAAELAEIQIAEEQANAREQAYSAKVERTTLVAPADGIVSAVNVKALGSILQAGTVVAEIVPVDAPLVILARLPAEDIAQVKKGQRSEITVTAFDVAQFGTLTGRIQKIAGNTTQPSGGAAFYETYVEIMDGRFSGTKRMAELVSGMEVVVDIVGGKRTILSYVLTPFNRAASLVFREN